VYGANSAAHAVVPKAECVDVAILEGKDENTNTTKMMTNAPKWPLRMFF
jgi:hypothetical protein